MRSRHLFWEGRESPLSSNVRSRTNRLTPKSHQKWSSSSLWWLLTFPVGLYWVHSLGVWFGSNVLSKRGVDLDLDLSHLELCPEGSTEKDFVFFPEEEEETSLGRQIPPWNNNDNDPNPSNERNGGEDDDGSGVEGGNHAFARDLWAVNRDAFVKVFDFGSPIDEQTKGRAQVLVLPNRAASSVGGNNNGGNGNGNHAKDVDASVVSSSCEELTVAVISADHSYGKTCLAVVGNGEIGLRSYHLHRWLRFKGSSSTWSSPSSLVQSFLGQRRGGVGVGESQRKDQNPLVPVGRGKSGGSGGGDRFSPVQDSQVKQARELFGAYLHRLPSVRAALDPLCRKVANAQGEIVVMTVNFGQAVLLENFVCHARAHGFAEALTHVLVFPTDQDTVDLVEGLGLAAYHDEDLFGDLPSKEARAYGDRTFVKMMMAKVLSVQMVNHMGYHVLFQDVDVVWYRDPLSSKVFTDKASNLSSYDMLFQDDGAHSFRYAPYAANSGYYYVRYNERTHFFFAQFLAHMGLIMKTSSHQAALIQMLTEHANLFGLRVKVLDGATFPGGFHYHRRKDLMKSIVSGKHLPYVFHMSWTANKDNKLLFMRQMDHWYVRSHCVDATYKQAMASKASLPSPSNQNDHEHDHDHDHATTPFIQSCCSTEAIFSCHYRDKPSARSCAESPPIDKGRPSFW